MTSAESALYIVLAAPCIAAAALISFVTADELRARRYRQEYQHKKEELAAGLEFPRPYIGWERLLAMFFKAVAYALMLKETKQ